MSDIAIKIENLSKKYVIGAKDDRFLYERIANGFKSLFSRNGKEKETEFWALRDINLEIKQGDVVGIIGKNGAGKSTLLKIISRITQPTTGRITIKGKVASILEVGTGMNRELTGRENIFINGAILGMKQAEIRRKFDEIVAFSGVEKFIDTPIKHYSSGMYVRLAFAIAAHLEPDILIIDEVLAVGDAEFQKKCLGKMEDVSRKEGRTVLFVSHNMTAIQSLCEKAIWINQGQIKDYSDTKTVISKYQSDVEISNKKVWSFDAAPSNNGIKLLSVSIFSPKSPEKSLLSVEDDIIIDIKIHSQIPFAELNFSIVLYTSLDIPVFNSISISEPVAKGYYLGQCFIPKNLLNDDTYRLRVLVVKDTSIPLIDIDNALNFEISDVDRKGAWFGKWEGVVRPSLKWETKYVDDNSTVDGFNKYGTKI
jgi:lipopolysaccharide transport system ATP-binding protein